MNYEQLLIRHRVTASVLLFLTGVVLYLFGGLVTQAPLHNHETPNLYYRIAEYVAEFKAVGFPPAIFPNSIKGGGFAFPLFYPPLGYYVASLLTIFRDSYYLAGNLSLFLSVLISAYTCYFSFRQVWSTSVSLSAAVMYVAIPYRFVDAIARGALAECWTFAWYPVLFCACILLLHGQNKKGTVLIALSGLALLLSHSVMAMYFISMMSLIMIIVSMLSGRYYALGYHFLGLGFAFLFAMWYIIPQQVLWPTVKAGDPNLMWATLEALINHNTYFSQFFFSDPKRWLGGSNMGVANDGMSFELGLPYFIVAFVSLAGFLWFRGRRKQLAWTDRVLKVVTVIALVASILFLLKIEWFLRYMPHQFLFIQFGWRMLGISAFFCVAAYAVVVGSFALSRRYRAILSAGVMACSVLAIDVSYKAIEYGKSAVPEPLTSEKLMAAGDDGFVELAEYLPTTFLQHEMERLKSREPINIGDMKITSYTLTHEKSTFDVVTKSSSTLLLPLVAYPAYKAETQDGKPLQRSSYNGLLSFEGIQPGDTKVTVTRAMPEPQLLGLLISLAAAVFLGLLLKAPVWNLGPGRDIPFSSSERRQSADSR